MQRTIYFILLMQSLARCCAIVNPNQRSANSVLQIRPNFGPSVTSSGVKCITEYSRLWFNHREKLTRSPNMIITASKNMSIPAAYIQEGFLKHMNDRINTDYKEDYFQLRVISDAEPYVGVQILNKALVLADNYVLVIDSVQRLQNLMRHNISRMNSWNPGATFFILYNDPNEHNDENNTAKEIFEELLHNYYVHHIILLYAIKNDEYSFSVMNYFSNKPCRTLGRKPIGTCRDGKVSPSAEEIKREIHLYQNHFDYAECTFNLCASIAAPFVEKDCSTGIELRIITFIRNRLGFQLNQSCYVESRGVLHTESKNWTGLLGQLNARSCDFILGGYFPDNEVRNSFWSSDSYFWDSFTWYVHLAAKRPAWMGLYSIFQSKTWLCFILLLFLSWLFWYFVVNMLPEPRAHKELSLAGINALGVSICAAINERPLCNASRIFFLLLAIYGLNVSAIYTSKLIDVFSNPGFLHQIDNIDQVVAAGIPFGGPEENGDWFQNDDDMWIYDMYNDSAIFEPITQNLQAVQSGERVILSSRMYILQHNISDYIYAFPSNVFASPLNMIMKPGFPFLYDFNRLIRLMRDIGIFQRIQENFVHNNTYLNRIAKRRPHFQESAIVLTPEHLQGSIALLFIGCTLSTLAFLCELLLFHCFKPYLKRRSLKQRSKKKSTTSTKSSITKSKLNSNPAVEYKSKSKSKPKPKAHRAKHNIAFFQQHADGNNDVPTINVNVVHPIRFRPVVRRRVLMK